MTLSNKQFWGSLRVTPKLNFDPEKLFQEFSKDLSRRYVLEDVHGFAAWLRRKGYIE